MISQLLLARLKKELSTGRAKNIHVHANPKVVSCLVESYRESLERLEEKHQRSVVLTERETYHLEQFEVFGEV